MRRYEMNTALNYLNNTYQFETYCNIVASSHDENGHYVILDQTIFYPQGGGQPSDTGLMEVKGLAISVHKVKVVESEVRHYSDQDCSKLIGQTALCTIDREKRLLHAKLHTAGHLISNVVEKFYLNWTAVKGHHYPGQSYVEFIQKKENLTNVSIEKLNMEIKKYIELDALLSVDQVSADDLKAICTNMDVNNLDCDQLIRIVRINDFSFSPCAGTHVKSLKELTGLEITKCKIKSNSMKISYHINQIDN